MEWSKTSEMDKEVSLSSLKSFFLKLTRRSFGDLFLLDEAIIDYISDVLTRFARTDNLYRIKRLPNTRLETVVEMLIAAEHFANVHEEDFDPFQEREIRKHVGDYTLFMTGIFREYVERIGILDFYLQEGAQSYRAVSDFDRIFLKPHPALFEELANRFETYSGALDYMRKVYFRSERYKGPFRNVIEELSHW